jgi:hypothetical protein
MLFLNPEIMRSCEDLKIGKVDAADDKISYEGYMTAVYVRIVKLVSDFIKSDKADGATHEESINDCVGLIYSTLNFQENSDPTDIQGIVDEIQKSEEFQNWSTEIKYRFLNTHLGVTTLTSPIAVVGNKHPNVMEETIELVDGDDTFQVFLDGLAATNFID